eukprot:805199-Amphidinium_carterae.1
MSERPRTFNSGIDLSSEQLNKKTNADRPRGPQLLLQHAQSAQRSWFDVWSEIFQEKESEDRETSGVIIGT